MAVIGHSTCNECKEYIGVFHAKSHSLILKEVIMVIYSTETRKCCCIG